MASDLYTAVVTATDGSARSDDGALELAVHEPTSLKGSGEGVNPEQLMAAALGSCLMESLRIAATSTGGSVDDARVEARVTLAEAEGTGYDARYALAVTLPSVDDADAVLQQALAICPFTKTIDDGALEVRVA
ncbi:MULTISPECIES: OsmC family protein [Kineococcus]|uniref:OsmC family protein n=1 Tax=Kineococcus TaxID=33981 RepID=UPI0034DB2C89